MGQQVVHLGIEMRAGDDGQPRIGTAGLFHDLAGLEGLGDGDKQYLRRAQIGGGQHIVAGGVAADMLDAQVADRALLHHQQRQGALHPVGDQLAHPAIAHHHRVPRQRGQHRAGARHVGGGRHFR